MSSFPARSLEIWRSCVAESMSPISGAFSFEVLHAIMLQFLAETALQGYRATGEVISGFLTGMRYANPAKPTSLLLWRTFPSAVELFAFNIDALSDAIRQLELHVDINLTFARVSYLADIGRGPELPLLIFARQPFGRGIAFEIEERGAVTQSFQLGDFHLSDKAFIAQQHYSTGMALLAGQDSVSGLIDAAYMQFYLSTEATLEQHEERKALQSGQALFGSDFDSDLQRIVCLTCTSAGTAFSATLIPNSLWACSTLILRSTSPSRRLSPGGARAGSWNWNAPACQARNAAVLEPKPFSCVLRRRKVFGQ